MNEPTLYRKRCDHQPGTYGNAHGAHCFVPVEPDEIIDIAADTTGHYPQGSGYFALLLPAGKYAVVGIGDTDE